MAGATSSFITVCGPPYAVRDAVNELISKGDYAKILDKRGVTSSGIPTSAVNPTSTL